MPFHFNTQCCIPSNSMRFTCHGYPEPLHYIATPPVSAQLLQQSVKQQGENPHLAFCPFVTAVLNLCHHLTPPQRVSKGVHRTGQPVPGRHGRLCRVVWRMMLNCGMPLGFSGKCIVKSNQSVLALFRRCEPGDTHRSPKHIPRLWEGVSRPGGTCPSLVCLHQETAKEGTGRSRSASH